jgi:hypothetical protein
MKDAVLIMTQKTKSWDLVFSSGSAGKVLKGWDLPTIGAAHHDIGLMLNLTYVHGFNLN